MHTQTALTFSAGITAPDSVRPWVPIELFPDGLGYTNDPTNPFANIHGEAAHYTIEYGYTRGIAPLMGHFEWVRPLRAVWRFTVVPTQPFPTKLGVYTCRDDMAAPTTYAACKNSLGFKEYFIPGTQQGRARTFTHTVNFSKALGLTPSQWNGDDGTWFVDHNGRPAQTARVQTLFYYGSPDVPIVNQVPVTLFYITATVHQVWQVTGNVSWVDPDVYGGEVPTLGGEVEAPAKASLPVAVIEDALTSATLGLGPGLPPKPGDLKIKVPAESEDFGKEYDVTEEYLESLTKDPEAPAHLPLAPSLAPPKPHSL